MGATLGVPKARGMPGTGVRGVEEAALRTQGRKGEKKDDAA